MTPTSPRFRPFRVILLALVAVGLCLATPVHSVEADGCGRVRRLLRLHEYSAAVSAMSLLRNRHGYDRCHIPADVLQSHANVRPTRRSVIVNKREKPGTPLTDGRRIHHMISTTAGALLMGYMVAGTDRVTDNAEIRDTMIGFGTTSLLLQSALAFGNVSDRTTAIVHTSYIWGSLSGAIIGADWRLRTPELPPWEFDDDGGFEGALTGMLTLGPLLGVILNVSDVTYEGISQFNSALSYGLMIGWFSGTAFSSSEPEDGSKAPLLWSLLASGIGGAVWRSAAPLPRWRTTMIDLGAISGALLGSGLTLAIGGDQTTPQIGAFGAMGGMVAGMVTAGLLGERLAPWMRPSEDVELSLSLPQPTVLQANGQSVPGVVFGATF